MKNYIKNHRRLDKSISRFSLIFWIINLVFIQIAMSMLLKIITASKESWFDETIQRELRNDPMFADRTELIIKTIEVIMLVIVVFSIVTVVLFRNIQLRNMLTQMGVLTAVGYNKWQIFKFCMMEPIADIVVTFPLSVIISIFIWQQMGKFKAVSTLQVFMNDSAMTGIVAFVVCAALMVMVTMIHTKYFVEVNTKKGIRYMLGKGIV